MTQERCTIAVNHSCPTNTASICSIVFTPVSPNFFITYLYFIFQGDRERDQEAAGRRQRGVCLHPWVEREAGARAEEEGVRQVLKEVLQHAEGVLQGGTVSHDFVH